VGFDLIEEEDRTHSTLFFAEEILAARRDAEARGLSLPLFLHSGETSRAESENLYDALLLGAPRIGHGLALVRHPLLMEMARDRGIPIEVGHGSGREAARARGVAQALGRSSCGG